MSGHTPGEWTLRPILSGAENDKGWRIFAGDGRDGWTWIADVSPVIDNELGDASDEGKANAALLKTAPELLAALRLMYAALATAPVELQASDIIALKAAADALDKAEGR